MVDLQHIAKELGFLQTLHHPSIVEYIDAWLNESQMSLVVITERMKPGTIIDYAKKMIPTIGAIKRWLVQILRALLYLHEQNPPIIHRDIKGDNIFINSTTGLVKLGDFGLATTFKGVYKTSIVGTAEFLAPEVWSGHYDTKADIWSFGMTTLQLATLEYPYSECLSRGQVFSRISKGILPLSLKKLDDPEIHEFITFCLNFDPEERPGATQVLNHPFLKNLRQDVLFLLHMDMNDINYIDSNNRKVKLKSEDEINMVFKQEGFKRRRSGTSPHGSLYELHASPQNVVVQQLELQTLLRRHTHELIEFDKDMQRRRQDMLFQHEHEVVTRIANINHTLLAVERLTLRDKQLGSLGHRGDSSGPPSNAALQGDQLVGEGIVDRAASLSERSSQGLVPFQETQPSSQDFRGLSDNTQRNATQQEREQSQFLRLLHRHGHKSEEEASTQDATQHAAPSEGEDDLDVGDDVDDVDDDEQSSMYNSSSSTLSLSRSSSDSPLSLSFSSTYPSLSLSSSSSPLSLSTSSPSCPPSASLLSRKTQSLSSSSTIPPSSSSTSSYLSHVLPSSSLPSMSTSVLSPQSSSQTISSIAKTLYIKLTPPPPETSSFQAPSSPSSCPSSAAATGSSTSSHSLPSSSPGSLPLSLPSFPRSSLTSTSSFISGQSSSVSSPSSSFSTLSASSPPLLTMTKPPHSLEPPQQQHFASSPPAFKSSPRSEPPTPRTTSLPTSSSPSQPVTPTLPPSVQLSPSLEPLPPTPPATKASATSSAPLPPTFGSPSPTPKLKQASLPIALAPSTSKSVPLSSTTTTDPLYSSISSSFFSSSSSSSKSKQTPASSEGTQQPLKNQAGPSFAQPVSSQDWNGGTTSSSSSSSSSASSGPFPPSVPLEEPKDVPITSDPTKQAHRHRSRHRAHSHRHPSHYESDHVSVQVSLFHQREGEECVHKHEDHYREHKESSRSYHRQGDGLEVPSHHHHHHIHHHPSSERGNLFDNHSFRGGRRRTGSSNAERERTLDEFYPIVESGDPSQDDLQQVQIQSNPNLEAQSDDKTPQTKETEDHYSHPEEPDKDEENYRP